ncbi:MAG: hypothetical protein U5R49_10385 [Deltaproteobacteria bacterium]|nr:hypothetical protein [Deltaproteobacteria bacterium]
MIISMFISGVLISFVLSSFIKPEFYSIASLLVQEPRSKISSDSTKNPMVPRTADQTYVLSEAESLKSTPFIKEVLSILPEKAKKDLDINLDPYEQIINGLKRTVNKRISLKGRDDSQPSEKEGISSAEREQKRIASLQRRVIIKSKSKNAMIWITARSANPEVAPLIVKSFISVWMAKNLEDNKRAIRVEKRFALEQRNMARKNLKEAAKALMDFKEHYEIPPYITPEAGLGDMELQSEFERLQSELNGAKERFEYLDRIFLKLQMEESGIAETIKVLDAPNSPGLPSKTKKQEILLMGVLGALAVGVGIALGLDFVKSPIRHEKDITSAVDIPILGYVPRI